MKIPEKTKLWIGYSGHNLDSYDGIVENKNKEFGYEFDYETLWDFKSVLYKGLFELVEENDKLIIHCPTKEDYIKIVDKIGWDDGEKKEYYWDTNEERTLVWIKNNRIKSYGGNRTIEEYKEEYPDYKFITAKEFLGEEEKPNNLDEYYTSQFYYEHLNNKLNNNKKGNNIMCKAVKLIKRLGLSAEDKILIEYDCKDGEGNWTDDGKQAIYEMEAKDRRYKSLEDMFSKLGITDNEEITDIFLLDDLIKKHTAELVIELQKDKKSKKSK